LIKDYYKVLGLLPQADDVVVKAAYKALAQKNHPDKHPTNKAQQTTVMSEINEAFAVLGVKSKRKAYDIKLEKANSSKESKTSPPNPKSSNEGATSTSKSASSNNSAKSSSNNASSKSQSKSNNKESKSEHHEIIQKLKKNQMDEFELISLFEKFFSLKIEVKNGYVNSYSYKKEGKVQVLSFESIKIKLIEHLNPS